MDKEALKKANYINKNISLLEDYISKVQFDIHELKNNSSMASLDINYNIFIQLDIKDRIRIGIEIIQLLEKKLEHNKLNFTKL